MTVNFVNRGTMEELTIEEISGIAFIYNQVDFITGRGVSGWNMRSVSGILEI